VIGKRLLVLSLVPLLSLVALSGIAIYYAAFTTGGLRFIVSHVPKKIGKAQLSIAAPRGTLAHGFEVDRVELEHERTHLILEGIKGRIALAPLLWQTLDARDVKARYVFVEVRRRKWPVEKYTPRFLPPGITIHVERARAESATLIATNGRRFDTTRVTASGVLHHRRLRLFETSFDWEAMHVAGRTDLRAADPMRIKGDARITISWPGQPVWTIEASGRGDLDTLALQANFTAPFRADFTGHANDLTSQWNWSGAAQVHDLDLRAWGGGGALGRVTGKLAVKGDAKGFGATGPLTPAGLRAGAFDSRFSGSYANRVITADRIELRHPSGALVEGAGDIGIVSNGPRLNLHGGWRNFRWPLVGTQAAVRSTTGQYTLNGVWPFEWHAVGQLIIPKLPASVDGLPFDATGRLAKDRVLVDAATVTAFEGRMALAGEALWSPDYRWSVRGRAAGINPAVIRPNFPGQLNFGFEANGVDFSDDGDFALAVHDIAGVLRKVPASGHGRLARRGREWAFDDIRLKLGRTQIAADGRVADEIDLLFAIDTDDLGLLTQGSRGQLHTKGTWKGTLADPVVQATLHGGGIEHEGVTLESVDGSIDFDARNQRASRIDLRARNLAYRKRSFSTLSLALDGTAAAHVTSLSAKTGDLALEIRGAGTFAHGAWSGQLRALSLDGGEALRLALDSPVAAQASAERTSVERFCLHGAPAQICAQASSSPDNWMAAVDAKDLPLSTLTSGLNDNVEYRGSLTIAGHASGGGTAPLQGNFRADLVDARILHRLASGRLQSILLGSGLVTATATPDGIEGRMELGSGRVGTIKGRAMLARSASSWQEMPLQGELKVETGEIGFITLYFPQIDRAAGRLAADLAFSGTAGAPLLNGTIHLTEAELDQYQVNMALRGVALDATLSGTGLDFKGSARIGAGEAHASGQLNWRDAQPYGQFHLEGQNLRLTDVPEAQIEASPDLDFKVAGKRIEVSGAVVVPRAKIVPTDLRNAVRSSADEVIVGERAEGRQSKSFDVTTDIKLTLGDRVSIDTSGLTGLLKGSIALRSGEDAATLGTGELSVEEGKYTAYARKLDIQRGRLIFNGGTVANPGVDIRAIKQFPDVIAGVNVRGTLLSPRLTFFSEPPLPQSQILSLILAGGSLQSAQNRQTGNEILAQGGAIIAQQLGSRVGIEDVSVESNLSNETSLVLGKYLSPRLYISYGISLAESINTLKLQYSLNDHWTVKSEFGEGRGADLVYTIEK
jgi:translocation and assembly module TamB